MKENFVIYNEEYVLIKDILQKLKIQTHAQAVFITDSEGHCIASSGEMDEINLNSISSLIAGSVAAINSIAQMLGIDNFAAVLNESTRQSLHISLINERAMLVVIFDNTSNLGLVRYRVRSGPGRAGQGFHQDQRETDLGEGESLVSPFEGVSDEDIDRIFGD